MKDSSLNTVFDDLPRDSKGLATAPKALTQLRKQLPEFLKNLVTDAEADSIVIGLDGGIETTLAATFAVDAIGQDHVTGLIMPAFMNHEAIAQNAETIATSLGIEHNRIQLQPVLAAFQDAVGESNGPADDLVATNNAVSRLRMACIYYVANISNSLVVGPINRTQYLLGSVTKHGETAADCFLFGDLYRTEVRALARDIGIPNDLTVEATGSPLHPGQPLGERLDIPPETVDRILRLCIDVELETATVANRIGVEPSLIDSLVKWCRQSRHKRHQPPSPATYL